MSVIIKEGLELQDRFWRNIPNGYDENNPILVGESRLRLSDLQGVNLQFKNLLTHNTFQKARSESTSLTVTMPTSGIFDCICVGDTNARFIEITLYDINFQNPQVLMSRGFNTRDVICLVGRVFNQTDAILQIELRNSASTTGISASHLNIGIAYPLERKNYDGVRPFDLNVKTQRQNTISENGQYLGSFIKRQYKNISIDQNNIEQNFNYLNPFSTTPVTQKVELEQFFNYIAQADQSNQDFVGNTFFYAWNGEDAAYCWPKSNCEVTYKSATIEGGLLDWTLEAETK